MQPRQLLVVAAVTIAAFAAAFGIAKAGGEDKPATAARPAANPAKEIEPDPVTVEAAVPAVGNLPSLNVPEEPEPETQGSDGGTTPGPTATPAPQDPGPQQTPAPSTPVPDPTPAPTEPPINEGGSED